MGRVFKGKCAIFFFGMVNIAGKVVMALKILGGVEMLNEKAMKAMRPSMRASMRNAMGSPFNDCSDDSSMSDCDNRNSCNFSDKNIILIGCYNDDDSGKPRLRRHSSQILPLSFQNWRQNLAQCPQFREEERNSR